MNIQLLEGELVRLAAVDPETMGTKAARWFRNSDFARLLDEEPARLFSAKNQKEGFEKDDEDASLSFFSIRALAGDRLIGFMGLFGPQWNHSDAWVGLGLGEREDWGKGYGTDAMRIMLRYAFTELNLHRVTLDVFAYNPRGIRSYEKAGFKVEGRQRECVCRDGRRWDVIVMGILREEWEQLNHGQPTIDR